MFWNESPSSAPPSTLPSAISVSELLVRAKSALERALPLCWVSGEISGFKRAASGHCYFDLKDDAAQISCVLYRNRAAMIGFDLKDGAQVELRVRPAIYEPRGSLQFAVEQARLAGVGRLFEAFLRLKAKLQTEGLFDEALKRPLPLFPRRVGLITSLKAAALADMLRVLRDRWPRAEVIIYPASVQGANAPSELLAALHNANTRMECEVLVIGRGGGSIEDLWAFNDEALTRAVAASMLPIVSAVGHETDFSLCDFAADARAPTPTAAAVMITPELHTLIALCANYEQRIQESMRRRLDHYGERLDRTSARLRTRGAAIAPWRERWLRLDGRLQRAMSVIVPTRQARVAGARQRLALLMRTPATSAARVVRIETQLSAAMAQHLREQQRRLAHAAQALTLLDPQQVLDRGYALVFDANGQSVSDASTLAINAAIQVKLKVGGLAAHVTHVSSSLADPSNT